MQYCQWKREGSCGKSVDVIRHKSFGLLDEFESFVQAELYLRDCVTKLNAKIPYGCSHSPLQRLEQERQFLYSHPGRMECFTAELCKVDKYATICVATNRYSVPDKLVGKMVFVKSYSSWLKVSYNEQEQCGHSRSYERFSWHIDLNHYLVTLQRKPGAVGGSVALQQAPENIRTLYVKYFKKEPKGFVELLQYCQLHNISHDRMEATTLTLANQYANSVDVDHILALLGNNPVTQCSTLFMPTTPNEIEVQALANLEEIAAFMN